MKKRIAKLVDDLNNLNADLRPEVDGSELTIVHPKYNIERSFDLDVEDNSNIIEQVEMFLKIQYQGNTAIYYEDYYETLITLSNVYWLEILSEYDFSISVEKEDANNIFYEIGSPSDEFQLFLDNSISHFESSGATSLTIYNINKILKIRPEDAQFLNEADFIAKAIIFDIAHKSSLPLQIMDIRENDEPFFDGKEKANQIKKTVLDPKYDKDLIRYYYRALQMNQSEFQYMAYYQVIECIFDEVYLHETIQDAKRIIESSNFSTENRNNIKDLIQVINRYNKEQNDRNKTKLVLEKYFKGAIHQEALYLSNKEIIDILKDDLKLIKEEKDIEDIQKLANIIYDYRCECTHSNRAYPIERNFEKTEKELVNYISLIKKIAEKVILNYKKE